jgi:hypothetical protein
VKSDLLIYALLLSSVMVVSFGNIISFALISYGNMHDMWRGVSMESLALCMPFALPILIVRSILGLHLGLIVAIFETIIMGTYAPAPGITAGLILTTSIVACV